jgi:transposase
MEKNRQFNQEQKLVILESEKEVGIKEAPRIAGVHYTTVYEWRNGLEALGRDGFCHTVLRVGATGSSE